MKLGENYKENIDFIDRTLRTEENFDIIKKSLRIGDGELTFYYIDGFVKDGVTEKLMIYLLSQKQIVPEGTDLSSRDGAVRAFTDKLPYVETEITDSWEKMLPMFMSGASLIIGSCFGEYSVIVDSRTYPARSTEEPTGDKVLRGARDGFVETLIFNTAMIRRRIRDASLTMKYLCVGEISKTDIAVCYMNGTADAKLVERICTKISSIKTDALTLGHESLAECLIKRRWYNPFPKIRYTERPDAAAAQIIEGSVIVICDNSPDVMIIPTSFFEFIQETNDFYFPPLTGSYIRILRFIVFGLTLFLAPTWYLLIMNQGWVPEWLNFIIPMETGRIPIIIQIYLVEFVIDGLRMASLNTPDMLSNSLSVVGGLILGDFAVSIGWLIPEVILYMSFSAIANFTQRSYELGYAFKFMRMALLLLTALFNIWGYIAGVVGITVLLFTNKGADGKRSYMYPLIPFNGKALASLFIRRLKSSE